MKQIQQDDIDKLADILWWLKGYGAATKHEFDNCPFDMHHIAALDKIIPHLKNQLYDETVCKPQTNKEL